MNTSHIAGINFIIIHANVQHTARRFLAVALDAVFMKLRSFLGYQLLQPLEKASSID